MASPPAALTTLLAKLAAAGVDFVLVGGLAAVAQGAPLTTHDIDIVHRRAPENVDALFAFLSSANARYRGRLVHRWARCQMSYWVPDTTC